MNGADEVAEQRPDDASAAVHRRRWGARAGRAAALLVAGAAVAWAAGFAWFAGRAGQIDPAPAETSTDAIVVLTGGSNRLAEGFRLLDRNLAGTLFVTGVYQGVEVAELLALAQRDPAELACCVVLGYAAGDTRENAAETAAWMAREGHGSLRLVTSDYHMARSLLEFRRALPGVAIVPHPVEPQSVHLDEWWAWPGTAALIASEWNKYLLALLRGPAGPLPPPEPS